MFFMRNFLTPIKFACLAMKSASALTLQQIRKLGTTNVELSNSVRITLVLCLAMLLVQTRKRISMYEFV